MIYIGCRIVNNSMPRSLNIELIAGVIVDDYIPPNGRWNNTIQLPEKPSCKIIEMSQREFEQYVNNSYIKEILSERPSMDMVDCIFHEPEMMDTSNIIGYRIASCDDTFAFGLMEVLGTHEEYQCKSGYKYCHSIPLDEEHSSVAHIIRTSPPDSIDINLIDKVKQKIILIQNGWNYRYFKDKMYVYAVTTQYVLSQIGVDIDANDVKLMIVWYWK